MKVFLASSRESIATMRKVALWVEKAGHTPIEWDSPEAFIAGEYTFARIIEVSRNVDAAIFVFGKDDKTWYRTSVIHQPRDNVLVEYGLFAGAIGPDRVLICQHSQIKIPTDLEGILNVNISEGTDHDAFARVSNWLNFIAAKKERHIHSTYSDDFVEIVADNRHVLDPEYRKNKYNAEKVDILGMALSSALSELSSDNEDELLNRVLFNNAQVRLMFLSPRCQYINQRAIEDGDSVSDLKNMLKTSVINSVEIFKRFSTLYTQQKELGKIKPAAVGFLEIRITDFCPHFTMYRVDDILLWGIYSAATRGDHSAVLRVKKSHDALFRQLMNHFEKLWLVGRIDRHTDDSFIVKCHSRLPPVLNKQLVAQILENDFEKVEKVLSE